MYERFTNYNEWKNRQVTEPARKIYHYDIPNNKFIYWIFTPKELKKEH